MTDQEQPSNEPKASAEQTGEEQLTHADQPAAPAPIIDDERKYTTREAGDLLGLRWRTIVQYIRKGSITAEKIIGWALSHEDRRRRHPQPHEPTRPHQWSPRA